MIRMFVNQQSRIKITHEDIWTPVLCWRWPQCLCRCSLCKGIIIIEKWGFCFLQVIETHVVALQQTKVHQFYALRALQEQVRVPFVVLQTVSEINFLTHWLRGPVDRKKNHHPSIFLTS